MTMEKHPDDKKPVVEYTAKITLPNGEVIEKTVSAVGTFPSLEDFDLSTRDGFLKDFDLLEKTVLETSRKLNGELSREYLDVSSKKNRKQKQGQLRWNQNPDGLPYVFMARLLIPYSQKNASFRCPFWKPPHVYVPRQATGMLPIFLTGSSEGLTQIRSNSVRYRTAYAALVLRFPKNFPMLPPTSCPCTDLTMKAASH